jgi:crossover junction endodeoxyribonuclease RusA
VTGDIVIELWGVTPQQQGSKNPWGGDANKKLAPFREALGARAAEVMLEGGHEVIDGPVQMDVVFVFGRPAAHFGTGRNAGVLKDSAPGWHSQVPDRDKLLRAIGDAMTKVVYRDDARICDGRACKIFTGPGYPQPGVKITIRAL